MFARARPANRSRCRSCPSYRRRSTLPDCRIRLHFIPAYCPHLNPIERLWGVMHKHVTTNATPPAPNSPTRPSISYGNPVPRNWADLCDSVTDNFRVISPKDFRVMA
ncbi:MAG: transposase [Rhodoplanes sp.]